MTVERAKIHLSYAWFTALVANVCGAPSSAQFGLALLAGICALTAADGASCASTTDPSNRSGTNP